MPTGPALRKRRRRNQRLETLLPGRQGEEPVSRPLIAHLWRGRRNHRIQPSLRESPVQSGGSYSLGCVVGRKLAGEKEKLKTKSGVGERATLFVD
ncbi:hypothetical protein TNCV_4430691 [Trichonephila clavipes]|nr:hypothetical protein TNCV_4430691 [Trichonephila clavipes]